MTTAKQHRHPGKPSGNGKGILQRAVLATGRSRRESAFIVDTVIDLWKKALARHEDVELPIGALRVVTRKPRRRFNIVPKLKGTKPGLYVYYRRPHTVQLVKKNFEGDPAATTTRRSDVRLSEVPLTGTDHSDIAMAGEIRDFRPPQFARISPRNLRVPGRGN